MNKSFVLFVIMLIGISSSAQNTTKSIDWEWAPIGAVWMYETANMGMSSVYAHYWYVRSVKDTVYNGVNCRKLEVIRHYWPDFEPVKMPDRFTYQDGGDIYFYNSDIDEFVLSFSYDIQYGDTVTWQMPVFEDCINSYYLDTVLHWDAGYLSGFGTPYTPYNVFMNSSTSIKSYRIKYLNNNCYAGELSVYTNYNHGRILDYMGSRSDIFELSMLEELQTNCMCYYDEIRKINCASAFMGDTIIYAEDSCLNYYNQFNSSILSEQEKGVFRIYPNPVTNNLHINLSETGSYSIEIISLEGKSLFYKTGFYGIAKIELKHIEYGIYIVVVKTISKVFTKKIIKI